jgi:hypothetical protein
MATTNRSQNRIMRTYTVTLQPFDMSEPVSVEVNLSYKLKGLEAIDLHGNVIEPNDLVAHVEAVNRLRRLAETGRVGLDPSLIDTSNWKVDMTRHTLVRVETDENDKPIRKGR